MPSRLVCRVGRAGFRPFVNQSGWQKPRFRSQFRVTDGLKPARRTLHTRHDGNCVTPKSIGQGRRRAICKSRAPLGRPLCLTFSHLPMQHKSFLFALTILGACPLVASAQNRVISTDLTNIAAAQNGGRVLASTSTFENDPLYKADPISSTVRSSIRRASQQFARLGFQLLRPDFDGFGDALVLTAIAS